MAPQTDDPASAEVDQTAIAFDQQLADLQAVEVWKAMDALIEQIDEEVSAADVSMTVTVTGVAGLSGVMSVGYLVWAIRGGSLLASVLSTVPIWRLVDPLPVIDRWETNVKRRTRKGSLERDKDEQRIRSLLGHGAP